MIEQVAVAIRRGFQLVEEFCKQLQMVLLNLDQLRKFLTIVLRMRRGVMRIRHAHLRMTDKGRKPLDVALGRMGTPWA